MPDLDQALDDISSIRGQLAAGTIFRGFAPAIIAATGGLALITTVSQYVWPEVLAAGPLTFLDCWIVTALIAAGMIGAGAIRRSRRYHGGLSNRMMLNALERFLPAGIAGAAIAIIIAELAPDALWMLPGFWQILVALGIFAALPSLPRATAWAGAWYFVAGLAVLVIASETRSLSPWMMGIPFVAGQFLVAAVLHFAFGKNDADDEC